MTIRTVEQIDADIARLQAERSVALQNAPLILPTSFMTYTGSESLHVASRFDMQGDLKIAVNGFVERGGREAHHARLVTWIKRPAAGTLVAHIERAINSHDSNYVS
jgi:hypothetical protein